MQDPALKNENWDRFLPKFQRTKMSQKKIKMKEKKVYTPFPPPQQESKVQAIMCTVLSYITHDYCRLIKQLLLVNIF